MYAKYYIKVEFILSQFIYQQLQRLIQCNYLDLRLIILLYIQAFIISWKNLFIKENNIL
jgi:hypothetical protein